MRGLHANGHGTPLGSVRAGSASQDWSHNPSQEQGSPSPGAAPAWASGSSLGMARGWARTWACGWARGWAGQDCGELETGPAVVRGLMVLGAWHGVLGCEQGPGEMQGWAGTGRAGRASGPWRWNELLTCKDAHSAAWLFVLETFLYSHTNNWVVRVPM